MKKLSLRELGRIDTAAFKALEKTPIVIVLDNIRSALNVGSAFRTSDAFALEQLYLCGITATPPHREILKTAIGASDSMDWQHYPTTLEAIKDLKAAGYKLIAVEQVDTSISLQDFRPKADEKYALIFGNEVKGVSEEILEYLDACIEVPQFGTKHSLNVSVCMGVVVWDVFQKLRY